MKRFFLLFFALALFAFAKVNINDASVSELESLKGIGKTKATAIVEYRDANGKFKSIEELTNVKGIGKGVFEKIKDEVEVSASSTAK